MSAKRAITAGSFQIPCKVLVFVAKPKQKKVKFAFFFSTTDIRLQTRAVNCRTNGWAGWSACCRWAGRVSVRGAESLLHFPVHPEAERIHSQEVSNSAFKSDSLHPTLDLICWDKLALGHHPALNLIRTATTEVSDTPSDVTSPITNVMLLKNEFSIICLLYVSVINWNSLKLRYKKWRNLVFLLFRLYEEEIDTFEEI